MSGDPRYTGAAWQAIRADVLERDAYECQIRGDECTGRATEVDHIVPSSNGGAFYDPANLRAACEKCNRSRGARMRADGWRTARTHIAVEKLGPARATSWAAQDELEHETEELGAALIDSDTLGDALGSEKLGHVARRLLVGALTRGELGVERVVVVCHPGERIPPHHRELGASDDTTHPAGSRDWLAPR